MMLARRTVLSLIVPVALALPALAQPVEVRGNIEAVTVYRGQALVTRAVDLPAALAAAAGGVREVIVTDLPPRIRPESLHAESTPGLRVRSVSFRTRPVVQDTREEVRAIDSRIEAINTKITANRRRTDLLGEHKAYLASLQAFVAPSASTELTKGVLNAETIEKLSLFLAAQRTKNAEDELTLGGEAKALAGELEQAQRERVQITQGSSRSVNEAVVLLAADDKAPGVFRLRYLVDEASWEPSYNVRASSAADGAREAMVLEYQASIRQMSGEDWGGVTMTLSTATPSLVASAPRLTPMLVGLGAPAQQAQNFAYADVRKELAAKQKDAEDQRFRVMLVQPGAARQGEDKFVIDGTLNKVANDIQVLEILESGRVDRAQSAARVRPTEEGLSVTYAVPGKAALPSRADRQLIQIAAIPLKASFTKIAAPVLTGYIYDEAAAANTSPMVLLAGPVTAYADGAFVGGGDLPTIASGERFTTGFGIDSALRTGRELVERTETIQGGNRVVEMTYRLSVENFGTQPAHVRLMDRLPAVDAKRSDIRITLTGGQKDLCADPEYLATQRKDGLLRWDVTVPPQSTGRTAFILEYTFRLEFDRQMVLTGLGG